MRNTLSICLDIMKESNNPGAVSRQYNTKRLCAELLTKDHQVLKDDDSNNSLNALYMYRNIKDEDGNSIHTKEEIDTIDECIYIVKSILHNKRVDVGRLT